MGGVGLPLDEVVVGRVGISDAKEQSVFGTIPDFHRVQLSGVGGCSWYGDVVGGGVSANVRPKHLRGREE